MITRCTLPTPVLVYRSDRPTQRSASALIFPPPIRHENDTHQLFGVAYVHRDVRRSARCAQLRSSLVPMGPEIGVCLYVHLRHSTLVPLASFPVLSMSTLPCIPAPVTCSACLLRSPVLSTWNRTPHAFNQDHTVWLRLLLVDHVAQLHLTLKADRRFVQISSE